MTNSTCQASRMLKSPNLASAQGRRAYTLLGGEFPRRSERAQTLLHAHFPHLDRGMSYGTLPLFTRLPLETV